MYDPAACTFPQEVAVRTPLIIRAPWMTASVGRTTDVLGEAVDLYPTLAALVGLADPHVAGQHLNGTNLAPVFADPADTSIKAAAFRFMPPLPIPHAHHHRTPQQP